MTHGAMTNGAMTNGVGPVAGSFVTAEGVVLELDTAGPASRMLARALDLVMCSAAVYALLLGLAVLRPPMWMMFAAVAVSVFLALFVYPVVMETASRGRTVGKMAAGIRVVTDAGGPIRFRHAAVRAALSVVDLIVTTGFLGIVTMIVSPRHQRLGDLAAGTVVVRTRTADRVQEIRAVTAPAGYESFIASLDIGHLDRRVLDLARAVLLRQRRFPRTLQGRVDLLAGHVDGLLDGRRPAQMPSLVFLQCVCAADSMTDGPVRPLPRLMPAPH